jgi:hypothetical protein
MFENGVVSMEVGNKRQENWGSSVMRHFSVFNILLGILARDMWQDNDNDWEETYMAGLW